ncbi:TPA: cysteine hydrolase [Mannheimia haemolytica]|uniref:Peroxyureidoacrylate/ureidoacrylate amidohydrolase RutB n=1 Tax=Mannheimia haemolytica TaxID=75985 RepID=A0A378NGQ8_MANHA|nr:cysteine hydrolase [Mannheimia haemolytica]EEY09750.1 putative amidase [Mannheimia haemolytica serotype A2 str. OVINE]EEY12013.1 putative amidase [Mannheimia haemolytica serotype A2 str. BOVINE]KYL16652.1 isochorismatase [Mannheimia haemolytica]KYL21465.1 isochorismatase [Mannheimia haemolytica]MDW0535696.1 cysteine hydrolase [Mannheimia haemolytica]
MMSQEQFEEINQERRQALNHGSRIAMAASVLGALGIASTANAKQASAEKSPYAEPEQYGLKRHGMTIDPKRVALVVVDPQIDFLSPKGVMWGVLGDSIKENNTVANIESLFKAAKAVDMPTFVSSHYYYPTDHKWEFGSPGEHFMHDSGMFARKGQYTMEGFENSGADFMPEYKPYIFDGKTVIASPHKIFGPETNDLVLQLRKRKIDQVILAGMAANLCIDSHLRELIEQGFEVTVVKDATAGPRIPEGDGYLAALTNYRIIANDLWTTEEAVKKMTAKA